MIYDSDNDVDIDDFNGDVMAVINDCGLVCRGIWHFTFRRWHYLLFEIPALLVPNPHRISHH